MSTREENFERMLAAVQDNHRATVEKLEQLKAEEQLRLTTFRQLLGDKVMYENMLHMYQAFGLLAEEERS